VEQRIRQVLTDWGIDAVSSAPDYGIHSWRCAYYLDVDPAKGGGACDCVDRLVADLVVATEDND
jgi:hypothetical protein